MQRPAWAPSTMSSANGSPYPPASRCCRSLIAAGDVALGIVQPVAVYPGLVAAGKIKVIALTGARRPDFAPSAWPTLAEGGLPVDATLWLGMFAPLGTPDAIVAKLDK